MTVSPPAAPLRSRTRTTPPPAPTTIATPATSGQRAAAYLIDVAIVQWIVVISFGSCISAAALSAGQIPADRLDGSPRKRC